MPKIYIITSYYPPEIGAASNRIYHLAQGLKARGFQVNVIAPLPNYPTGEIFEKYKGKLYLHEIVEEISIRRLWLYPTNSSNKAIRLFSMLSYSISLMVFYLFHTVSERVIVQCPPLLVAFTSMFFLRRKRRTLVLNVSDLWPSIGIELGALKEGFFVKVLRKIEKFNYKKADLILGQSNEILSHVENLFPNKKLMLYRNFPVFDDVVSEEIIARDKAVKVVYAGLLGEAQGILDLCKQWNNEVELHLYGEGSERDKIEDYLNKVVSSNIFYHGNVKRSELHLQLLKYDLALIALKRRLYGSVPSKIFEYSKLGLPLLYFGGGEGEDIVREYNLGLAVNAGNYNELNEVLQSIKRESIDLGPQKRIQTVAREQFNLEIQLNVLAEELQ